MRVSNCYGVLGRAGGGRLSFRGKKISIKINYFDFGLRRVETYFTEYLWQDNARVVSGWREGKWIL